MLAFELDLCRWNRILGVFGRIAEFLFNDCHKCVVNKVFVFCRRTIMAFGRILKTNTRTVSVFSDYVSVVSELSERIIAPFSDDGIIHWSVSPWATCTPARRQASGTPVRPRRHGHVSLCASKGPVRVDCCRRAGGGGGAGAIRDARGQPAPLVASPRSAG